MCACVAPTVEMAEYVGQVYISFCGSMAGGDPGGVLLSDADGPIGAGPIVGGPIG